MFPHKIVDDEWGREWEGAIFTVHVGFDGDAGEVSVGDRVAVLKRKHSVGGAWYFMRFAMIIDGVATYIQFIIKASAYELS